MSIKIVPGEPMPDDEIERHWELLAVIRSAREAFDPGPIVAMLAPHAIYESQGVLVPLEGREEIAAYLEKRFEFFAKAAADRDIGRFLPGVVDLPEASDHPCLIFKANGERQALWVLDLTEDGFIARVDILTVAPTPDLAREVSWD